MASDGAEAVRLVADRAYDLVFMDVQMPDMDGLAATRAIRGLARHGDVPIVAMTAQALPDQIAACHAAGMDDHLAKPIARDSLQAMIRKWSPASSRTDEALSDAGDLVSSLRARFVERSVEDLARMRGLIGGSTAADADELRSLVHRLAGAAGTFGFQAAGDAALALDQSFAEGRSPAPRDYGPLLSALEDMCAAA